MFSFVSRAMTLHSKTLKHSWFLQSGIAYLLLTAWPAPVKRFESRDMESQVKHIRGCKSLSPFPCPAWLWSFRNEDAKYFSSTGCGPVAFTCTNIQLNTCTLQGAISTHPSCPQWSTVTVPKPRSALYIQWRMGKINRSCRSILHWKQSN